MLDKHSEFPSLVDEQIEFLEKSFPKEMQGNVKQNAERAKAAAKAAKIVPEANISARAAADKESEVNKLIAEE